ncbi:hypothetical protein AAEX28_07065 [Lentisphaerota bacterium WC36G]|nr:hypothetical protein LJT99_09930 [Lentisphaerae bacterium WC36]
MQLNNTFIEPQSWYDSNLNWEDVDVLNINYHYAIRGAIIEKINMLNSTFYDGEKILKLKNYLELFRLNVGGTLTHNYFVAIFSLINELLQFRAFVNLTALTDERLNFVAPCPDSEHHIEINNSLLYYKMSDFTNYCLPPVNSSVILYNIFIKKTMQILNSLRVVRYFYNFGYYYNYTHQSIINIERRTAESGMNKIDSDWQESNYIPFGTLEDSMTSFNLRNYTIKRDNEIYKIRRDSRRFTVNFLAEKPFYNIKPSKFMLFYFSAPFYTYSYGAHQFLYSNIEHDHQQFSYQSAAIDNCIEIGFNSLDQSITQSTTTQIPAIIAGYEIFRIEAAFEFDNDLKFYDPNITYNFEE